MNSFVISVPSWVAEDKFPRLLSLLSAGEGYPAVEIDISNVKFLTPAAVVAILARCNRWKREGKAISLSGADSCENLGYLQRIDFLNHLGVTIPENFIRRNPAGRFVPVQTLNFASGDVDRIASEISRCTLPDASPVDDVYRLLQYAAGELLSNAKYHSGGRAFVCAQFFQKMNLVRIAVADDGIGIRGSFLNTSRETEAATPDAAIRLALQPQVSSALLRPNPNPYAGQNHRGVGLSITRILAQEAGGQLSIVSEDGWFDELHGPSNPAQGSRFSFPARLLLSHSTGTRSPTTPPCTPRQWPRSEWAFLTRVGCLWIERAAKFRLSARWKEAMMSHENALKRTKSPPSNVEIP